MEGKTGLDEDKCWLIGINWIISSLMFIQTPLPQGRGKERKGGKRCLLGWLSLCSPAAAALTTCQISIVRALFFFFFSPPRFCFCFIFRLSLLVYLPKCREWSLTFFSIFATLLGGGDVVHNSRFSHLVYSLTPPSLFFSLSHSFLLLFLLLLPAVNDWSGTDRPPLRSVLLQRCPLLFLLIRFSLCPPSS